MKQEYEIDIQDNKFLVIIDMMYGIFENWQRN